jgi:hypothetical protein
MDNMAELRFCGFGADSGAPRAGAKSVIVVVRSVAVDVGMVIYHRR